jgi:hypothetical protein
MMTLGESYLAECWNKIGRAQEHLDTLTTKITAFLEAEPYTVLEEYDSEQSKYLFKLKIGKFIPQIEWALLIGDCVHNMRSTLDYLAWRLAGSDLADRRTTFPIYIKSTDFDSARGRLARIHEDAIVEIRKLQPYSGTDPKKNLLWLLQELDARDKHKLLTVTQTMQRGGAFNVVTSGISGVIRFNESGLDDGAIVAEVAFLANTPQSEVKVKGKLFFDVTFQTDISTRSVRGLLRNIIAELKGVIWTFERLLTANPHWLIWF